MADKAKTSKAVVTLPAITVPTSTAEVPALIGMLEEQLEKLKGDSSEKVSTDISYNGTNIKNVSTAGELLKISAAIVGQAQGYAERHKHYGLEGKVAPFTISDKTEKQWDAIIGKALNNLINKTQIDKLTNSIKELQKFLSEEDRFKNTMSSLVEDVKVLMK